MLVLVSVFLAIVVRLDDILKTSGRRVGRLEQMMAALISATVHKEAQTLS